MRWWIGGVVLATVLDHYAASSALSWTGAGTTGARVQTSLAAPFLLAVAACLTPLLAFFARRRGRNGGAVLLGLAPWIIIGWGEGGAGLPFDRSVPAPELYSGSVRSLMDLTYKTVGNPWVAPANLVFYARYREPPSVFDQLVDEGTFMKHYRWQTLESSSTDVLSFANPPRCFFGEGYTKAPDGAKLEPGAKARFLVTLYWPWITHLGLRLEAQEQSANVTLRSAGFIRSYELGSIQVEGSTDREIGVPKGAFDSGINEVVIETDAPVTFKSLKWIDRGAHDSSIDVFPKMRRR